MWLEHYSAAERSDQSQDTGLESSEMNQEFLKLKNELQSEQIALQESILPPQHLIDGHESDFDPDGDFIGDWSEFKGEYGFSV